jgi:hypothetical protein
VWFCLILSFPKGEKERKVKDVILYKKWIFTKEVRFVIPRRRRRMRRMHFSRT